MKRMILVLSLMAWPALAALDFGDLALLEGRWIMEKDGKHYEEFWTAPIGESVAGMYRVVADGKGVFYELMVIEQDPSGPVLKLRHFNRGSVGWEEKDKPLLLPIVSLSKEEVVFENEAVRLTYRRTSADTLQARLLRKKEQSTLDFSFRRAR